MALTEAEREALEWSLNAADATAKMVSDANDRGYKPETGDPIEWERQHKARVATLRSLIKRLTVEE